LLTFAALHNLFFNAVQLKLIFCLSLITFNILSQEKIEWQEPIKVSVKVNKTLKTSSNEFYTIGSYQRGIGYTYYTYLINYFKDNQLQESQVISESDDLKYYDAIINDNSIYVLFEENNDLKHKFYAQKYDQSCKPIGDLITLSEVNGDHGTLKGKKFYSFSQSKNRKFFCLDYHNKNGQTESYGYKIFSSDFQVVSKGEKVLPYLLNESKIISKHITDSGKYFVLVNVYDDPNENDPYKQSISQKKVVLHEVINGGLSEGYDLTMKDNMISDVIITSDKNNTLTLSGLYIEKAKIVPNVMGFFCKRINTQTSETMFSFKEKIDEKLIMSNVSKEQERERRNSKEILKFKNRELLFTPDSSIILILEQSDTIAYISTTNTIKTRYSFNELFIFKINKYGKKDGTWKIPKDEVIHFNESISTHLSYFKENELVLLFRDNKESYNSIGEWNSGSLNITSDYANTYKDVGIAKVSINLESGVVKRAIYTYDAKMPLLPIPHLFKIDELNKTILIVMENPFVKGEQYGIMHY